MSIKDHIREIKTNLPPQVTLVAVSKTHPAEDIMEAYDAGQRIFGESRPQEMKAKYEILPKDIRWHMIGHLQTNKVKYIAPFVELIHSVDSVKLTEAIDKEAKKCGRTIDILLEIHIAREESKSGWDRQELTELIGSGGFPGFGNVRIRGLMGIASLTTDEKIIRSEFTELHRLYNHLKEAGFGNNFDILSMGMTSDYRQAVECGSNMVRIGSLIFGEREYR